MSVLRLTPHKYSMNPLNDEEIAFSSGFITGMLAHIVKGGTINTFYHNVSKAVIGDSYVCETRMRLTLSIGVDSDGVEALQHAYRLARDSMMDVKFDELFDMFDAEEIRVDPRLASAYKGKADNIKWCLSRLKPKVYGDKVQVEHTIDNALVDRLTAGRDRLAALDHAPTDSEDF